jgi:DNA-binding protein HU-beta
MRSTFRSNDRTKNCVVRNVPSNVSANNLSRNIRILLSVADLAILLMMMMMTMTMVVAFTPLDVRSSISTRKHASPINIQMNRQLLQQPPPQPALHVLKSTPTEEQDATNDTPTKPTSKSNDAVDHFLKPKFIDAIHQKTGLTKKESENMYKIFFDIITEQLLFAANTDPNIKMKIPKFGTFFIKLRPERTGKNPRTGDPITIAASKIPTFTPASNLKDLINGKVKTSKKNDDDENEDEDE